MLQPPSLHRTDKPLQTSGQEGYGAFIGTAMIASFLQMGLSFVPKKYPPAPAPPHPSYPLVRLISISPKPDSVCSPPSHQRPSRFPREYRQGGKPIPTAVACQCFKRSTGIPTPGFTSTPHTARPASK
jgi:hypothetical protein